MVDKEKKGESKKEKYVSNPSFEKYRKNIYSSKPEVRKYLYQIQKDQQSKYNKQQAEIKAGVKPSKSQYIQQKAYEGVNNIINKYSNTRLSYRKGNPLSSLLKTKQQTVHVSGNKDGEHINLMRARW